MPRQNDKDNGRKRGPARPRPRGEGSGGGKGRPRPTGKPPGRSERSRSRDGDDERRKGPAAAGKPARPMSKPGGAARPARGRPSFRRDDERGAERPPRKAFGGGDRTRRDGDEARPLHKRPSFRRDDERGAERPPRKAFGGGDRTRRDGDEARPPHKRPSFRRDDERGGERPPRKAFGGGDRMRRDGDEARPPHKRPSFRRDDERGAERPPRQAFGDRRRADAGDAKPYRKDGPPRRFERPRARDDDAPRPERKHFSRPRDDRRDARPSREAEHGRGRWQEHPRSDRRDDARPPRPATGSDRPFRKRPAFDAPTVRAPRKPRAVQAPPPSRPDKSGERIAKVVARAGLASRREAEAWITAGRVAVNGRVITSPALDVTVRDVVTVDGQRLPEPERTRLFLYHKPRGLMTTHADPEGRPTVFDNLPEGLPRLISVGRLDFNTEGLLLLTNDGGLARALELPQTGWLRRYRVRAHGEVTQPQLDALRGGIVVDGIKYGSIEATLEREQGSNVWLVFAIREGKNREVRNVLAHLGLDVTRLIRVSYGPFQLGEIEEGKVEEVKTRVLREQIGETLLRRAGSYFAPAAAEAAPGQAKAPGKPRVKRAVVADRKGRKVVVERAGGDDGEPRRDGSAPYRRPQRRYHGKRDLTRKEP